jgi:putative phosphotransacetylase
MIHENLLNRNLSYQKLVDIITEEVKNILPGSFNAPFPRNNSNQSINNLILSLPKIPLGISNRHIHLTSETFHTLFGEETEFESMHPLYQPGEFASKHLVTIIGPKLRCIPKVRILGPLRKYDQVEVSLTDAIVLGINPPVESSGTLDNAAALTLVGPNCSIHLKKCAIIANRHIHMTNKDAERFQIKNGELCKVRISGEKSTVFENVLVRINDNWKLQIHLDTDDANAANVREDTFVEFIGKM